MRVDQIKSMNNSNNDDCYDNSDDVDAANDDDDVNNNKINNKNGGVNTFIMITIIIFEGEKERERKKERKRAGLHFIILTKKQPLISVQWIGVVIIDQLPKQSTYIKVDQLIFYPLDHSLTP